MREKINKIIKTGYGLGLLSINQAQKIVGQVKEDLHLNNKESLRLAQELVASSEKVTIEVLKTVDKHLSQALIRSKLIKKRELFRVKSRLKKAWQKRCKKMKRR